MPLLTSIFNNYDEYRYWTILYGELGAAGAKIYNRVMEVRRRRREKIQSCAGSCAPQARFFWNPHHFEVLEESLNGSGRTFSLIWTHLFLDLDAFSQPGHSLDTIRTSPHPTWTQNRIWTHLNPDALSFGESTWTRCPVCPGRYLDALYHCPESLCR